VLLTRRPPPRWSPRLKPAAKEGDSLGGIVEVIATEYQFGTGHHVQLGRKLDGLLAGALMSIQAVKAVETGDGIVQGLPTGSVAHDAIAVDDPLTRGVVTSDEVITPGTRGGRPPEPR